MPAPPPGRAGCRRARGTSGATAWRAAHARAAAAAVVCGDAARATRPKVTILLVHAWGMGGTIRTMLTVAGRLARRHEVEVLSVWRTREEPFFPFPPGVTVTASRRPPARLRRRRARLLAACSPAPAVSRRPHPAADDAVDRRPAPARTCGGSRSDVLIGTRPALNFLVAGAGGGPARVASEHAPVLVYHEPLQREIWRRYHGRWTQLSCSASPSAQPLERISEARRRCT